MTRAAWEHPGSLSPAPNQVTACLQLGGWPQGDRTAYPILGRHLGPVHRFQSCHRFIVHGRDPDTIGGARRQLVDPRGLPRAYRHGVRLADGTIGNNCMTGHCSDGCGKRGPRTATSCVCINGSHLIDAEITCRGPDAITGEGSRPPHSNRIGAYPRIC